MSKSRDEARKRETATEPGSAMLARFETAWNQALTGGPEPMIEDFLAEQPESERPALLREMEKLSQGYRSHRGAIRRPGSSATVDYSPAALVNTPEPAAGGTVEFQAYPIAVPAATIGVESGA